MGHVQKLVAATTMDEARELCETAPRLTQAVLQARRPLRNVQYRREISFIIGNGDLSLFADSFLGVPTVKWALHAPMQAPREHRPGSTIQDQLAGAENDNKRLIARTRPSKPRYVSVRVQLVYMMPLTQTRGADLLH